MKISEVLLPCPFCGGKPQIIIAPMPMKSNPQRTFLIVNFFNFVASLSIRSCPGVKAYAPRLSYGLLSLRK